MVTSYHTFLPYVMSQQSRILEYESGAATAYMSRNQAIRKLQLTIADFRRLCILKGIYPHEPKHKKKVNKGSTQPKTYYMVKDINFLAHEPIITKFREFKHYIRRLKKAVNKKNNDAVGRIKQNKPKYQLDHIVRERYPSFVDALRDLDDCLSMCFLFATFPRTSKSHLEYIGLCRKVSVEFLHYIIASQSLRKVFISIKGIYYQAEIMNQTVTWVVPHKLGHEHPTDVDYKIMQTFVEFYTTLLGFVNFRLYSSINLHYPPKLELEDTEVCEEQMTMRERLEERLSAMTQSLETIDAGGGEDEVEIDEFPVQSSDDPDQTDKLQAEAENLKKLYSLFKGLKFYLNREVPRESLTFIIRSFGGMVSWCKTTAVGATYQENDETITHQVVDRPEIHKQYMSRYYIQPQWVFDCVNACSLLPVEDYFPGVVLPPHLSPFVTEEEGDYIPPERRALIAQQTGIQEDSGVEDPSESDQEEEESEEEEVDDEEERLKKRLKRRKRKVIQDLNMSVEAGTPEQSNVDVKIARQANEERRLAEMMIPKKKKRLYEKMMKEKKQKAKEIGSYDKDIFRLDVSMIHLPSFVVNRLHCVDCQKLPQNVVDWKLSYNEGDVMIGAFLELYRKNFDDNFCSDRFNEEGFQAYTAIKWSLEKINRDVTILPGIKLGYFVIETCLAEAEQKVMAALRPGVILQQPSLIPRHTPLVGILGESVDPIAVATERGLRKINTDVPMFVPSSVQVFNDRTSHPGIFRTTIPVTEFTSFVLQLLELLDWTYVHAVYTIENKVMMDELRIKAKDLGICFATTNPIEMTNQTETIGAGIDKMLGVDGAVGVVVLLPSPAVRTLLSMSVEKKTKGKLVYLLSSELEDIDYVVKGSHEAALVLQLGASFMYLFSPTPLVCAVQQAIPGCVYSVCYAGMLIKLNKTACLRDVVGTNQIRIPRWDFAVSYLPVMVAAPVMIYVAWVLEDLPDVEWVVTDIHDVTNVDEVEVKWSCKINTSNKQPEVKQVLWSSIITSATSAVETCLSVLLHDDTFRTVTSALLPVNAIAILLINFLPPITALMKEDYEQLRFREMMSRHRAKTLGDIWKVKNVPNRKKEESIEKKSGDLLVEKKLSPVLKYFCYISFNFQNMLMK
ncbi:hypothetical protein FSP39_011558 [Pinctada imbricata]|uniref:Pescadillo homolog n=1 Tax=Pinctada imbricata TaxID=66713 RepID=A0AA89BKE3_PINIB|nr:hypothetical protein FSP39_011558 [Pinctada imbricata]